MGNYKLQAIVSGGPGDVYNEVDVFLDGNSLDKGREAFEKSVRELTDDFNLGVFF